MHDFEVPSHFLFPVHAMHVVPLSLQPAAQVHDAPSTDTAAFSLVHFVQVVLAPVPAFLFKAAQTHFLVPTSYVRAYPSVPALHLTTHLPDSTVESALHHNPS